MYSKIILVYSLCCFLLVVKCNLNKEEGDACEWEGVKGTCVNSHRCLTTLDDKSPKQPVCTQKGQETIVCCTDCELVNDTRNSVLTPKSEFHWKTGQKAWDKCLQYVMELPYDCHLSYHGGLQREFNEEKKCHTFSIWGVGGPPARGTEAENRYPHMVMIGYGEDLNTVQWLSSGTIISEKYILTAAHVTSTPQYGPPKFVAYGVLNLTNPENLKHVGVKNIVKHPDYKAPIKYNDIALIEVDTPITFDKNVLPACLHVSLDAFDEEAIIATRRDLKSHHIRITNTISEVELKNYGKEVCITEYPARRNFVNGFDDNTQLCYGDKDLTSTTCKGISGEPLLIKTHASSCVYTAIGVSSFGKGCANYDLYTKVSYYVPWIESVVWP